MRRSLGCSAALLATLALVSCGGESKITTSTQSPAAQQPAAPQGAPQGAPQLTDEQRQAFAAFQSCLREHGGSMPSGPPAGGAPQLDDATRKAMEACRDKLPSGGPPGGAPGGPPPGAGTPG